MLAGSALDPADQKRAAVEEATPLYVLPDIHRADATQEDLESIVGAGRHPQCSTYKIHCSN